MTMNTTTTWTVPAVPVKKRRRPKRLRSIVAVAATGAAVAALVVLPSGSAHAATAQDLLNNSRVALSPNAQADLRANQVDAKVIDIVTELARTHTLTVGTFITGHSKLTTSGNVSNHWYGRAVDITHVNGRSVIEKKPEAETIANLVRQRTDRLRPAELGQPWWNSCANMNCFTKDHNDHIHIGYSSGSPGLQTVVANVNACGALHLKLSTWGAWEQHMGCGQAKAVSVGPDGQTIAVVRPDNTLVAKNGLWGDWVAHVGAGDTIAASAGPGGMLANVNACGALYIKTSYWGTWQQHMGCGQAKGVSIGANGQTISVLRPDDTLVAKDSLWGNWTAHVGVGDSQANAAGPNAMLANVNACRALYIKTSYWGAWEQHMGCGQAKSVSIGPDGQTIAVVRPDNTLVMKTSLWGNWAAHVAVGDSQSASVGRA